MRIDRDKYCIIAPAPHLWGVWRRLWWYIYANEVDIPPPVTLLLSSSLARQRYQYNYDGFIYSLTNTLQTACVISTNNPVRENILSHSTALSTPLHYFKFYHSALIDRNIKYRLVSKHNDWQSEKQTRQFSNSKYIWIQGWHKKPNPVLPTRFNTVLTSWKNTEKPGFNWVLLKNKGIWGKIDNL